MKILLIEDDPILVQMYKDEFEKSEFELIVAMEGKQGILEASKEKPDFILLDIMMNGMNGVTAFRHLKSLEETKHIPVALLTVVPEGVPEALHKDPDLFKQAVGYWSKDKYNPIQISEMIREYLKGH